MNEQRPVGLYGDPILRLQREVADLKKQVAALKASTRPTIPVYSSGEITSLTDFFNDGEYWINANTGNLFYTFAGTVNRVQVV